MTPPLRLLQHLCPRLHQRLRLTHQGMVLELLKLLLWRLRQLRQLMGLELVLVPELELVQELVTELQLGSVWRTERLVTP